MILGDVLYPVPNGTPFSTPLICLSDGARLVQLILAMSLLGWIVVLGRRLRGSRQWGCYAVAAFTVASIWTDVDQLGTGPNVRTAANLAGVVFGLVYVTKVRIAAFDTDEE